MMSNNLEKTVAFPNVGDTVYVYVPGWKKLKKTVVTEVYINDECGEKYSSFVVESGYYFGDDVGDLTTWYTTREEALIGISAMLKTRIDDAIKLSKKEIEIVLGG